MCSNHTHCVFFSERPAQLTFSVFDLFLTQWIMVILSKRCKPVNFESHNFLNLSFTNCCLHSNFVECQSFLESNSPDIFVLCEANMDDSIDSGNFSVRGYFSLIFKYCTHIHCLACEGRTSFCTELMSRKRCEFLLTFSTGFTSLIVLLLFPLSINFFIFMHGFWFYFI